MIDKKHLWKWAAIILLPCLFLLVDYFVIDSPRTPRYFQYLGMSKDSDLWFQLTGSKNQLRFVDSRVFMTFTDSETNEEAFELRPQVWYGNYHVANALGSDTHWDTQALYCSIASDDVAVLKEDRTNPETIIISYAPLLKYGHKYYVDLLARHKGIIFNRPVTCRIFFELPPEPVAEEDICLAMETAGEMDEDKTEPSSENQNDAINAPTPSKINNNCTAQTKQSSQSEASVREARPQATETQNVTTVLMEAGHEWVDLGLSVKWATCNVGATSPSKQGFRIVWGETKRKSFSTWGNYLLKSCGNDINNMIFTKYNTYSRFGTIDYKTTLESIDDAASQNWGGRWRTATKAEWEQLISRCTWNWTSMNGELGYMVTGPNGNSIFLPRAEDGGIYWSATLYQETPSYAWSFVMFKGEQYMKEYKRIYEHMIRPVF